MQKNQYRNTPFHKIFSDLIVAHDKIENKTKEEWAAAIGIPKTTFVDYENGNRVPNIKYLVKISKYFDVSTDYLLGLSENSTTDVTVQGISEYFGVSDKTVLGIKNNFDYINKRFISKQEIEALKTSFTNDDFDIEFWNEYSTNALKKIDEQEELINIIESMFYSNTTVLEQISKFILSSIINQDINFYINESILNKLSPYIDINEYSKAEYLEYKQQKELQKLFNTIAKTIKTLFTEEERDFVSQSDNINSLIAHLGKWKSSNLNNALGEDIKSYLKTEIELMGLIDDLKNKGNNQNG